MYRFRKALGTQLAEVVDHRGKTITVPFSGKGDPPKPGTIVQLPVNSCCQPISCPLVPSVGSKDMPYYPTPRRVSPSGPDTIGVPPIFINTYPENYVAYYTKGEFDYSYEKDLEIIPEILKLLDDPSIFFYPPSIEDAAYIPLKNPGFNEIGTFVRFTKILAQSTHFEDGGEIPDNIITDAQIWINEFGAQADNWQSPPFWTQLVTYTLDQTMMLIDENTVVIRSLYTTSPPEVRAFTLHSDSIERNEDYPVSSINLDLYDATKALVLSDSYLSTNDWRGCIGRDTKPDFPLENIVPEARGLYVGNIAQPEKGGLIPEEAAEVLKSTSPPDNSKIYQIPI